MLLLGPSSHELSGNNLRLKLRLKGRVARCQQGHESDLSLRKNVFFKNPKSKFLFCFDMNTKHFFRFVKKIHSLDSILSLCHHPKYTLIAKYNFFTNTVLGLWFLLIGGSRLSNSTLEFGLKKVQKSLIKLKHNFKRNQILRWPDVSFFVHRSDSLMIIFWNF